MIFNSKLKSLVVSLLGAIYALTLTGSVHSETRFIAYGDMPYGNPEISYPFMEALIEEINRQAPDFVFHVGDTRGGRGKCSDKVLLEQLEFMNSIQVPVIYTPGDNEWTDCHRTDEDPRERLNFIRQNYFAEPTKSLGGIKLELEHQGDAGYPENSRFIKDRVMFLTAHVVGSNNGLEATSIEAAEEFFARNEATTAWLNESFEKASGLDAVVLAIHADMFEFDFNEFERENWLRQSGFSQFGPALQHKARVFEKPVLLVFGDSHIHRVFNPFPKSAPNVLAVEVYGNRDMHAVEITVKAKSKTPFTVRPVWNPKQK